jgi:hypothetical protein
VGFVEGEGEAVGDGEDGGGFSGADVDDLAGGVGGLEGESAGEGDVFDVDEVALLEAVFVDEWWGVVEESGGEDGEDAGVGVGKGLAGAVDVEEAEGDGGDGVGAAGDEAEAFLVEFGEGVDGGEGGWFGFGGGEGGEGLAGVIEGFPLVVFELVEGAVVAGDDLAGGGLVEAFAVEAHGGGDDETLDGGLDEDFEEDGGAEVVDGGVVFDFVHGLADADGGGEVEDGVDVVEGGFEGLAVADVADEEFDVFVEVVGAGGVLAVDLRRQIVQSADVVAVGEEFIGEVGADEACAAGDEDSLGHGVLRMVGDG